MVGSKDARDWWLTEPSAQRAQWALAQRNRYGHYASTQLTAARGFSRLLDRVNPGRDTSAQVVGESLFWMQRHENDELQRLVMRDRDGHERTVIDPHQYSARHTVLIDDAVVSPDGRRVAVWTSKRGQEDQTLRIHDVATGEVIEGPMRDTDARGFVWLPDASGFYAEIYGAGSGQIYRHTVGRREWSRIAEVPGGNGVGEMALSPDGQTLVFSEWLGDWQRENLYAVAVRPDSTPVALHRNVEGRSTPIWVGDQLWLLTTVGSDRGRLVVVDPTNPGRKGWRDVIAPTHSRLREATVAGGKLLVVSSYEGVDRITVHDLDGTLLGRVTLPGRGEVESMSSDGDTIVFTYSDYTTPAQVMRFDVRTGTLTTVAAPQPVGLDGLVVHSTVYRSADGTMVPIDIVYKPLPGMDAPRPTILHAYGGFLTDDPPAFSPEIAAWVEAGGVYAHAHVRGGDVRSGWHRNGPEGKRPAVDDLAAAARFLTAEGYTTAAQIGLFGGSNGGWLTTATAVLNPGLVGAVVAQCGVLDLMAFARFGPGRSWVSEYGDARDPAAKPKMRALSPLQNVRKGVAYPPMLFTVGDDPRVDTRVHTYRMVEALQQANPQGTYVMRYDANVGHGYGAKSRTRAELSETLAFFARHLGLTLTERAIRGETGRAL